LFVSRRLILPLLCSAPLVAHAATTVSPAQSVVDAIERAVHARLGRGVTVSVSDVTGAPVAAVSGTLTATPDPSARVGTPVRFVLSSLEPGKHRVRVGEATAVVHVTVPAVRLMRPLARGDRIEPGDVDVVPMALNGRPLRPLPSLEQVVGARMRIDAAAGTVVTSADIAAEPLIRAGQVVRALARVDGVEVLGQLVAAESGMRGDVIRVVNQESRHTRRARITGSGEVEVVNVP